MTELPSPVTYLQCNLYDFETDGLNLSSVANDQGYDYNYSSSSNYPAALQFLPSFSARDTHVRNCPGNYKNLFQRHYVSTGEIIPALRRSVGGSGTYAIRYVFFRLIFASGQYGFGEHDVSTS